MKGLAKIFEAGIKAALKVFSNPSRKTITNATKSVIQAATKVSKLKR
jgi:hypothetical protein